MSSGSWTFEAVSTYAGFGILSDLDAFSEQDDDIASQFTFYSTGRGTAIACMLTQPWFCSHDQGNPHVGVTIRQTAWSTSGTLSGAPKIPYVRECDFATETRSSNL